MLTSCIKTKSSYNMYIVHRYIYMDISYTRFPHITIVLKYISVRTVKTIKHYTIIIAQYNTDSDNICTLQIQRILLISIYGTVTIFIFFIITRYEISIVLFYRML